MGSNSSKPNPAPSHVWQSQTPAQFSQNIIESLQSSTETDSTRAKTLELHIQARVHEELQRLKAREDQAFADVTRKISEEDSPPASSTPDAETKTPFGREVVQQEVQELRKKLEARKRVKEIQEMDQEVDSARDEVVKCLRANDRRPLDCWREVEVFKEAVGKLEMRWVDRTLR